MISNKEDLQLEFEKIFSGIEPFISNDSTRINLENGNLSTYSEDIASIEMFSRILIGTAPYLAGGGSKQYIINYIINAIKNGTDPSKEGYWGDVKHFDQRCLEMFPIAFSLYLLKSETWDKFKDSEKQNVSKWLSQINNVELSNNNCLLFKIIVDVILSILNNKEPNNTRLLQEYKRIDHFYVGGGWYTDGKGGNLDYYNAFGFHYYLLILIKLIPNFKYKDVIISRAIEFANEYIYFFSSSGDSVPYGRSLIYRYATSAFWSALAFNNIYPLSPGVIKGLILRNINWWREKTEMYNQDGLMTLGYTYENLTMVDEYNAFGSPYWSLKSFLILALSDNDVFWKAEIEEMPKLETFKYLNGFKGIVCRSENGKHVVIYPKVTNNTNFAMAESKYKKFSYSNIFGFSCSRNGYSYRNAALDSTLAISDGYSPYIPRNRIEFADVKKNTLISIWKPLKNVVIKSYIIPRLPYTIYAFLIDSEIDNISLYQGGYSVPLDSNYKVIKEENSIFIKNEQVISGMKSIHGRAKLLTHENASNTSILYKRTLMPALSWDLKKGVHLIISMSIAETGEQMGQVNDVFPDINLSPDNKNLLISFSEEQIKINFDEDISKFRRIGLMRKFIKKLKDKL